MSQTPFEQASSLEIGTVEFVSPDEIKIAIDIEAPNSMALNTGGPRPFPRVNEYLLIPVDQGFLVGQVEWITVERSPFPKRKGMQDFGLIDLPYPLRRLSLNPLGTLRPLRSGKTFEFTRGCEVLPSVGTPAILPTDEQLKAIVESGEKKRVCIGTSPVANNAKVYVDPDRLFGRHLAVLGNTGSGKSCTVAGLIRWCIEEARKLNKDVNARFILLDPNDEYSDAFNNLGEVKKFAIKLKSEDDRINQLKVPSWMWNSQEFASLSQATEKTQRPLLTRALREIKSGYDYERQSGSIQLRGYLTSLKVSLLNYKKSAVKISEFPGKQNYGGFLEGNHRSLSTFEDKNLTDKEAEIKHKLIQEIQSILDRMPKDNKGYFPPFSLQEVNPLLDILDEFEAQVGYLIPYEGPDEDTPFFFKNESFLAHLNEIAQEQSQQQYIDSFIMRIRSLFTDKRIASVISTENCDEVTLLQWLNDYIGQDDNKPSISIIDLSLLPSEVLYTITSVMARIVFEAHHRYKKLNDTVLPTVLVVEEAHNFIKRYETSNDASPQQLCTQIFEKIAKEGRKFGLGLVLSSQRPSELSPTVLSQCNTFLLHRISNDRDQELVSRLVPDNLRGLLRELPSLPSQHAILLGWASELPVLVKINDLPRSQQPRSDDPDFWNVWTGKDEKGGAVERKINWKTIADYWQQKTSSNTNVEKEESNNKENGEQQKMKNNNSLKLTHRNTSL
jgi:hypothetical protein